MRVNPIIRELSVIRQRPLLVAALTALGLVALWPEVVAACFKEAVAGLLSIALGKLVRDARRRAARELAREEERNADSGGTTSAPAPEGKPFKIGVEHPLTRGETISIGRSRSCDVQTPPDWHSVTRHHVTIDISLQGEVAIRDEDTYNGTLVNGVWLQPHVWMDIHPERGDEVLLSGKHLMCFEERDGGYWLVLRPAEHPR
jgi:FHA domain